MSHWINKTTMTLRKDSVDFYFVYDEQIKGHIFFQLLSLSALYVSTPASHWWCDRFATRASRTNLDVAAPVNAMHKTKTKRKEHKINNLPTHDMDRPLNFSKRCPKNQAHLAPINNQIQVRQRIKTANFLHSIIRV